MFKNNDNDEQQNIQSCSWNFIIGLLYRFFFLLNIEFKKNCYELQNLMCILI